MIKKQQVINALKKCIDPEIKIDVWTLGLIYDIEIDKSDNVHVRMTFTTPYCPYGPLLLQDINSALKNIKGVRQVNVEVVFDPPWQPSEELKAQLGIA